MPGNHPKEFVTDGGHLFCPRDKVNVRALRFGLAYGDQPSEGVIVGDHIRIPRHYPLSIEGNERIVAVGPQEFPPWRSPTTPLTRPRDYQVAPLAAMKSAKGGILNLGCGYGKTVLACYYMAHEGRKAAVLVDKTNLVSQWAEEIVTHLHVHPDRIGVVRGKAWEWEDKDIVIMSIQTLVRRGDDVPEGFYDSFGVAVFDECHHLAAPTFKRLCYKFKGIRLGLSATPNREDGLEQVFINHLGPVFYSKTDQELVPRVIFHQTGVPAETAEDPDARDRTGEIHYRRLCKVLGRQTDRNELAADYVNELVTAGHHVLCLTASVEHVTAFSDLLKLRVEGGKSQVGVVSGGTKADQRNKIISEHNVSVGTTDVASEALNVPSLSALVVLTPFGARQHGNTLKQSIGRIQRKHPNKLSPVCVFLEDENIGFCIGLTKQLKRVLRDMEYRYERRTRSAEITL